MPKYIRRKELDAPQKKHNIGLKRQITRAVYLELGGTTNPELSRAPKNGKWTYWRTSK